MIEMQKKTMLKKNLVIVGLGASAGGLEALQLFLSNLPSDNDNIAYVVVQHLSPTHKSMMRDLLARETTFDVLEIQSGLAPKANTVYITPPDRDVTLHNGLFRLDKPLDRWIGPKPSVDKFFISLAQEQGEKAVGVILSGTGSDGSQGVRAIRAEGGIAIAQKPDQAKYNGMPASAIQTKSVDYVLPAEEIAKEIIHMLRFPTSLRVEKVADNEFDAIFEILQEHIQIDFSQYKKSTVTRRIERRMSAIKATTLTNYVNYLKENKEEIELLYKDMLIGVTAFFRDKSSFDTLKTQIAEYIKTLDHVEQFRVWNTACSTGEEAYSIAILLDEIIGSHSATHIKIFATDVDEDAIHKARTGIFPEVTLSNMSPERLERYFTQKGNEFEVKPFLKERVIFSRHDITRDPPFVNIDLITCRNMLIYFETELQKRIFTTFAYSLKQHALLFLGKSESVGVHTDLFATLDPQAKIFQTRTTAESKKLLYPQMLTPTKYLKPSSAVRNKNAEMTIEESIKNTLFEHYESKCAVIDNDFNVHYIKGNMNDMLTFPSGTMHNNILKMLPEKLSLEVRSIVYKANKKEQEMDFPTHSESLNDDELTSIKIAPLEGFPGRYLYYLLCFETTIVSKEKAPVKPIENENAYIAQLEQELLSTREHLQTVVEELETSNEELQSSNEELQASNEELQASNEELETTNEELQSTNEELQTAYSEIRSLYDKENTQKNYLQDKADELGNIKKELDYQYHYLKEILDTDSKIVIVTDGEQLLSANNAFFRFFSEYGSIEKFSSEHPCICDFFEEIDKDGYIYDKKDGMKWLELLINSQRTDLKVQINRESTSYVFHIMANMLEGDKNTYVVSLTDISQIIASKQQVENELSKEIQSKISSSKILYQFDSIFGNDLIVHHQNEDVKKPLNHIYREYKNMLEHADFNEEESRKYLTSFTEYKNEILETLNFTKNYFSKNPSKFVNLYYAIEEMVLLFGKMRGNELKIEMFGDKDIEINDEYHLSSHLAMLLVMLFHRVTEAVQLKNIILRIEVRSVEDQISIRFFNNNSESLCKHLLQFTVESRTHNLQTLLVHDSYQVLKGLISEIYGATISVNAQECRIEFIKRFKIE